MDNENLIGLFTKGDIPPGGNYKEVLSHIVESFPFFQMAQVLYARQLYFENDPDITARLKLASAYAPDRKAMYQLFHDVPPVFASSPLKKTKDLAGTDTPQKSEELKYNFVYTAKKEIEPRSTPGNTTEAMPSINTDSLSETFLEKEIAAAAAIALTESMIKEIPPPKPAIVSYNTEPTIVTNIHSEGEQTLQSFSSWLRKMPMTNTEYKVAESIKTVTPPPQSASGIINRFLANEESISKPKTAFFSPSKAAKLSLSDDDNIVSETLADIYALQGNFPMALKAYETLLLQNPEKRAYFAIRIKEIHNQMDTGNSKK